MSHELPAHPNLEHLKNQGKAPLRDYQQDDAAAKERFAVVATVSSRPKLADALHVVAHEYGFASWPKLKQHVESVTRVFPLRKSSRRRFAPSSGPGCGRASTQSRTESALGRTDGQLRRRYDAASRSRSAH